MSEPTVVIEEVTGRSQQGITKPFICTGDDGHVYYVKGRDAGRRSQICEWVSAALATAFDLPIAEYALAEVPAALIDPRVRPDIADLGEGIVFASRQLPHAQELNVTTRALVEPKLAADILVFDWWLKNEDRHLTELGGNPNLLWDIQAGQLAVIDHNQAFDRAFNAGRFLESHVFSAHWNEVFSNFVERERYLAKMTTLLSGLNGIRDSIPGSWWFVDDGVPADVTWQEIATCLERCRQADFWNTP